LTKERLLGFDEIPTITDDLNVAEQDDNNVLPFESIPPIAPVFDPDEDEKEINDSLDDIMATEFDTPKVVTLRDKARKVLNLVHTGPFGTGGTKTKSEMTLADDLINAGKEMTTNLKIGGYRLLASAAANLKRRGMQFMYATGYPLYLGLSKSDKELLGIDSYEQLIRGYWEVLGKVPQDVPDPVPGISIPVSIADMPIMQSPPPLPLYERTGVPHVPGAFAGAVLDAAAKMPDAQRIYWEYKAGELGERQARFSYSQAPITRISRAVVQGGLPSYGISLGVSLLTGDYVFGLFVLGETAGGEGFQNQLDKGSGLIKAGVLGELIEAAEIGGELLVFPKVVKGFAKGIPLREFLVIVAENTGQEGVTGFAQRFLEVFGEATSKGLSIGQAAQLAIAEGVKAIPENAVVGGILAGGGAGTAITTHAVRGWITGDAVGPVAPMEVQEPTMKAQEGGEKALGVVQEPRTAVEATVTTPQGEIAPAAEEGKRQIIESQGDVTDTIHRILREQFPIPSRSAKSEAAYFDNGQIRIRVAEHPVVYPESDVDIVIGIGENAGPDSDLVFREGEVSEATIYERLIPAIEKATLRHEIQYAIDNDETLGKKTTLLAQKYPKVLAEYPDLAKPAPAAEKAEEAPAPEGKPTELPGGGVDFWTAARNAIANWQDAAPAVEDQKKASRRRKLGAFGATIRYLIEKRVNVREVVARAATKLRGQDAIYDKVYMGLEDILQPWMIDAAYADINTNPNISDWDRLHLSFMGEGAFDKLVAGRYLTEGDYLNIQKWRPELAKAAKDSGKVQKTGIPRRIVEIWRAGLLTGIKTTMLNELSNLSHAITELAKDMPGAGIDILQSIFTGDRTLALTLRGVPQAVLDGFKKGWTYLRTGYDERDIGVKLDYAPQYWGENRIWKALKAYHDAIFRLMGAEDQPFFYGAFARSLANQAAARGMNKRLTGEKLKAFIDKMTSDPTETMLKTASLDAQTAVFQNKTKLGDIGAEIQKKGGLLFVPFSRTPTAVAMQIVNYSPVGALAEVARQISAGKYNQRLISQAFGRSVLGIAPLYIGGLLMKAGLMTLDWPDNEREREVWKAENRKPFAVEVNNKWRSAYVLGPFGNLLLIGGYFQNAYTQTGSPTEAIAVAVGGAGKSLVEQTFLRGIESLTNVLTDPDRSAELFFSNLAGSLVPTLVADIARATDTTERRAQWEERILNRLPGARETLEPQIDVLGQDLPRYGGNVLEVMADPTRPCKIRHDIVVDELRALWDRGVKVAPTQLGTRKGFKILSDEENTELWRRAGTLTYASVLTIMQTPYYQKVWTDENKGTMIERVVKEAKDIARAEMVKTKLQQGVKVEELTKDGLLTQDVERYLRR